MFKERLGTDTLTIPYLAASGAIAGTCQVIATNPMEVVKINMQMQAHGGAPVSYGQMIRELGLAGLYKGVSATLLRYVPIFHLLLLLNQAIIPCEAFTNLIYPLGTSER